MVRPDVWGDTSEEKKIVVVVLSAGPWERRTDKQSGAVVARGPNGVPRVPRAEDINLVTCVFSLKRRMTGRGVDDLLLLVQAWLPIHGHVDNDLDTASY